MGCTQSDRSRSTGAGALPRKYGNFAGKTLLQSRATCKTKEPELQTGGLRLKHVQGHFHLSVVGMVPKPEAAHAAIEKFAADYAQVMMCTGSTDERVAAFMSLFSNGPVLRLEDPVGTAPKIGRRAIEEHAKLIFQGPPPSNAVVKKLYFTMDDFRAAARMFFYLEDGIIFETLDVFNFDSEYKIKQLSSHFHLSQLGMAPRAAIAHASIEKFIHSYVDSLSGRNGDRTAAFMSYFCGDPDIQVEDPVGTTPKFGSEEIKAHADIIFAGDVPQNISIQNVFFTMDDKICAIEMCCFMRDGSTFTMLDKLYFEGASDDPSPLRFDYSRDISRRTFSPSASRNVSREASRTCTPRALSDHDDSRTEDADVKFSQILLSL
eukprot:TRINITY_DN1704_c0_g1_i1.p1 TRINITY_DN1704_c0_g1~~TRINITY_DN1704_c0_g1_i1.p1  ORF type:complete len:404 (-),score=75.10 TRINITY_DN1704_c0_g1_i1:16-1146(-)